MDAIGRPNAASVPAPLSVAGEGTEQEEEWLGVEPEYWVDLWTKKDFGMIIFIRFWPSTHSSSVRTLCKEGSLGFQGFK